MITIKSPREIALMKESGFIAAKALEDTLQGLKPGVSLGELNRIADESIKTAGAKASFKTVEDYKYATCININSGIVHGIPGNYKVKKGDIVSIDLGAFYKNYHSDLSYTVEVDSHEENKFLMTGKEALKEAIAQAVVGNKLGDISNAIQRIIEGNGYSVSRELVGHGIGRELHEDPLIPGYGKKDTGITLEAGMVLAIEVIYQKGSPSLVVDSDGWTLKTRDNSLSGLFEHTVAITEKGPEVLTAHKFD